MPLVQLKNGVYYNVHHAIEWAEPFIAYTFAQVKKPAVVTCAKDGAHSENSRHFWKPGDLRPSQAVDLRIRDLSPWFAPAALSSWANSLVAALNFLAPLGPKGHFTLLLESDHIHLEWNEDGVPANIKDYTFKKEVYGVG